MRYVLKWVYKFLSNQGLLQLTITMDIPSEEVYLDHSSKIAKAGPGWKFSKLKFFENPFISSSLK